jgi:prepilin-type N-terminal cleavage/methylation domain-containing protein
MPGARARAFGAGRFGARPRAARGFSLIEVLVAAAVLSIGLLALASLQVSIVRTSADAKAFSVALSLAKDKVEELRSFTNVRGPRSYQSIADGTDAPGNVGGVVYARGWTVTRYAYNRDPDGNAATADRRFLAFADDTGDTPNPFNGNTGTGYVDDVEFKRIAVRVTWVDASGNTQTVALEDAIAALSPSDGALIARSGSSVIPRTVEAIIRDPTLTNGVANGVIPLALSSDPSVDGSSTAATNPQPKLLGADFRVAETRYNILTYGALASDGTATAESKIETVVVGCTCSYANANNAVPALRPAYWNGYRYTPPAPAVNAQPAGWTQADNESTQCTACCRDHHDQVGGSDVSNGGPKFDPRRASHQHYRHDASTGALVASSNAGVYEESCRLVRVDGVYRVTPDAYTDQVNLLETRNDAGATPFLPSTQATSNYQAFALKLLDARMVNHTSTTVPNASLSASTVSGLENPTPAQFPSTSVNEPASITIDAGQQKWLHARGLYIDYMEPEVIAAIVNAKTLCAIDNGPGGCANSLAKKEAAVLPLVPFTSINLTEIADWSPAKPTDAGGQDVLAYNNLLKCTVPAADGGPAAGCTSTVNGSTVAIDPNRPVRGMVQKISASAGAGNRPSVLASVRGSNSMLAALTAPVDPDEGAPLTDAQAFVIAGGTGGGSTASYKVAITGAYPLSAGARPVLDTSPASTYVYQAGTSAPGYVLPNPITVTPNPVSFGVPVTLRLKAYNYALSTYGDSGAITCTGPSGNKTLTSTDTSSNRLAGKQATCKNYAVNAVSVNGVAVTGPFPVASTGTPGTPNGSLTEYTTISLPAINANDVVTLALTAESDFLPPATCTYVAADLTGAGGWKNNGNPTVLPGACTP